MEEMILEHAEAVLAIMMAAAGLLMLMMVTETLLGIQLNELRSLT